MDNIYRIYGKKIAESRFKAFDYNGGIFVDKLIYATIINESEKQKAIKSIQYMNESNPEYFFKLVQNKGT